MDATYGFNSSLDHLTDLDLSLEEIKLQGFTILKSVFDGDAVRSIKEKVYSIYQMQESRVGKEILSQIGDENICRCPMAYDDDFLRYASNEIFMKIAEYFLDNYFVLSVQNANISKPNHKHVQSAWHRDLPYQNFTTSKPLAINFLVVIDDFTQENGGVVVLPFSHRMEDLPSQSYLAKHAAIITAKAGDVITFDSMLMHRAGANLSNQDRISFNHMYTRPFIKQQYHYADLMKNMVNDNKRAYQLSGISSRTASDDVDWRMIRKEKIEMQTT